jgi:hypothetical protein
MEHTVKFAFEVADIVALKGQFPVRGAVGKMPPQRGIITAMLAEFCPGGTQNFYMIRWMGHDRMQGQWGTTEKLFKHLEEELQPWREEWDG